MQKNRLNRAKYKKHGFSLIELLVVLSIISILVSLAFPKYLQLKIKAARIEAFNNLKYMYTLQKSYYSENGHYANSRFGTSVNNYTYGYHGNLDAFCTDKIGYGDELGFLLKNACKARYVYSFHTGHDAYNQTTVSTVPNDSPYFSAQAYMARTKNATKSATVGLGFGFSPSHCSTTGIFNTSMQGYRDMLVLNQDNQLGYRGEGHSNFVAIAVNAELQCK